MANFSGPAFDGMGSKGPVVWGFPEGFSIVDLVADDMKDVTHPHWRKFPPVNPMWHYLFAFIYIFLGITSVTGNSQFFFLILIQQIAKPNHILFYFRKFVGFAYLFQDEKIEDTRKRIRHEFGFLW